MSLDDMKSAAFRHCDKVVLAIVVLFVAVKVLAHFSPSEEVGTVGVGGGARPAAKTAKNSEDYVRDVTQPFIGIPSATTPDHDPFWPPSIHMLTPVRLYMGEPATPKPETPTEPKKDDQEVVAAQPADRPAEEDPQAALRKAPVDTRQNLSKAIRKLPAKLVGKLERWMPDDMYLRELDPFREARMARSAEMRTPCDVRVTVDRKTRQSITFEARKAGDWIGFQGDLEDKNKFQILIMVNLKDVQADVKLLGVADVAVDEEQLGQVVVRFLPEQKPKEVRTRAPAGKAKPATIYVDPALYVIYRQSEHDKKEVAIAELPGKGAGRRTPIRTRPGYDPRRMRGIGEGLPMGEGGLPPGYMPEGDDPRRRGRVQPGLAPSIPPGGMEEEMMPGEDAGIPPRGMPGVRGTARRGTTGIRASRSGEMLHLDSSVESETTYTYRVEARPGDAPELRNVKPKTSKSVSITTKQKFSFAYVGNTAKGAKIVVFIGPKDDPIAYRTFIVPRGGRVGEIPGEAEAKAKAKAEAEAEAELERGNQRITRSEAEEDDGHSYVTRFVLVDVVPQAARLLERESTVSIDGQPAQVRTYQWVRKHKAVIRDRKNRLLSLWYEKAPKPVDARGRSTSRQRPGERRRIPGYAPEMMEGEGMEGPPPGVVRPGRKPSRTRRRRNN